MKGLCLKSTACCTQTIVRLRVVAELEASLAVTKEEHGAALEQLEVQSLIAEHRASRISGLENCIFLN